MLYMVITNQKNTDMQNLKSTKPKYITKQNQQTMKEKERIREKPQNNHNTSNKVAINTYQLIITSNVTGLMLQSRDIG